jgi:hypothetical protein
MDFDKHHFFHQQGGRMSQWVRKPLGMIVGMAMLGTVFFVGAQSFAPIPATGSPAATNR